MLSGKKVPELSAEIGCSVKTLYRIERGQAVPDALDLAALAKATDQSVEFFYEGVTSPAAPNGAATISHPAGVVKGGEV